MYGKRAAAILLLALGAGRGVAADGHDARLVNAIKAGEPLTVEVTLTNTGRREGDEVVQLYLSFPQIPGAPLRALRGFKRVHLKPHESQKVFFELKERDLSMVSEAGEVMIAEGQYSLSVGGGQPNTVAPSIAGTFKVKGAKTLPE